MDSADISRLLAENTARLMAARGWTKAELARKLQTHQSNVGRMLAGHYAPSAKTLAEVATVFGVDVCELLCEPKKRKKG